MYLGIIFNCTKAFILHNDDVNSRQWGLIDKMSLIIYAYEAKSTNISTISRFLMNFNAVCIIILTKNEIGNNYKHTKSKIKIVLFL